MISCCIIDPRGFHIEGLQLQSDNCFIDRPGDRCNQLTMPKILSGCRHSHASEKSEDGSGSSAWSKIVKYCWRAWCKRQKNISRLSCWFRSPFTCHSLQNVDVHIMQLRASQLSTKWCGVIFALSMIIQYGFSVSVVNVLPVQCLSITIRLERSFAFGGIQPVLDVSII